LKYSLLHIARIIDADNAAEIPVDDREEDGSGRGIEQLLLDSRKVYAPGGSLFVALKGPRRDGHQFIPELYRKGVRSL
jgi:alanine racemase